MQQEPDPTVAVIVCRDDAHAFLLEAVLDGEVDQVVHVARPQAAIDLVMRGLHPALVLVDVELYDQPDDSAAAAEVLRMVAADAVVLEVGERLAHSGDELAERLRGNSIEAREWSALRG